MFQQDDTLFVLVSVLWRPAIGPAMSTTFFGSAFAVTDPIVMRPSSTAIQQRRRGASSKPDVTDR